MRVIRTPGDGEKNLKFALKNLDGKIGKTGWFSSAKYENGMQVAEVAVTQEYGDPGKNIPPRPFMRPTIAEQKAKWLDIVERKSIDVVKGKATAHDVMESVALQAAGDVRKTITSIQTPPLKDSTIYARASKRASFSNLKTPEARERKLAELKQNPTFIKPLIDSGLLLNSCNGIVEDKIK